MTSTDGFLLDTNIPSELTCRTPNPDVKRWVEAQEPDRLFLSVVTAGELHKGIALVRDAGRRSRLERWFAGYLLPSFAGRILPVTYDVAIRWGQFDAERQAAGRPLSAPDGMIAATAAVRGLCMVTRNVADFENLGLTILNPWCRT